MDERHSKPPPARADSPSPDRASESVVLEQYQVFAGSHCRAFFDTLPTLVLVLNGLRQVVFANTAAVTFLGRRNVEELLGLRPGEALCCVNADLGPGGCGTSGHCLNCGVLHALLAALGGDGAERDCTLLRRERSVLQGLDLRVSAQPLCLEGGRFIVCAITDISDQSRRRGMERLFFHDVLNLAGGISGMVEILLEEGRCGQGSELSVLSQATRSLVDEITAQRELLAAEAGELEPAYGQVRCQELLELLLGLYAGTPAAQGQTIAIEAAGGDMALETDARLVRRVLGNMVKNALEAGRPGDTVGLSCKDEGGAVRFSVRNRAVIPEAQQQDIFHRRTSTKGEGRGLGTYSMLLLSERYLGGTVEFLSSEGQGTTFSLLLPKRQQTR